MREQRQKSVDSVLSLQFVVKIRMHQGSVLSPFLFYSGGRCCHKICQRGCAM